MEDLSAEKQFEKYILAQFSWETLPPEVKKQMGNTKDTWMHHVRRYSIRHQLRWKTNLVRQFITDEKQYYLEVLKFSRTQYMLYPYHISDVLIKGLRVTPFKYYLEMMHDIMAAEKSYDVLPNFTAADCLRLLGIGRNQYIDIMNKVKAKAGVLNSWLFKKKRDVIKQFLPTQQIEIDVQHWWIVNVGFISEDDIQSCSEIEHKTIDFLIDSGTKPAGQLPRSAVISLACKGLIYFDVPVENTDQIIVPPLKDFVMNRVSGDYFENLLYKLFVSVDERTTVEKLSKILDIDVGLVKQAVSMYVRLSLAHKKNVEPLIPAEEPLDEIARSVQTKWHPSWVKWAQSFKDNPSAANPFYLRMVENDNIHPQQLNNQVDLLRSSDFLPLPGNSDTSTTTISPPMSPSPQQQQQPTPSSPAPIVASSHVDADQVALKRVAILFDSTLAAFLMMGNLGDGLKQHAVTMFEVGKVPDEQMDDFLKQLDTVGAVSEGEAQRYFDHAITLRNTLRFLRHNPNVKVAGSDGGIDMLRAERLNSLDHAAKLRLLSRSYQLLISMAPISSETLTITSQVPRHFGPVVPEISSVWFRLFLYHTAQAGPESILYPKGSRVTSLPEILRDCETVTVQTWEHDPTIVPLVHLLPTLNDLLLNSPVLVQANTYYSASTQNPISNPATSIPVSGAAGSSGSGGAPIAGGSTLTPSSSGSSINLNKPKMINVPFPMEQSLVEYAATEKDYTEETLHTHPTIKTLQRTIPLDCSFGFIRMKCIENPSNKSAPVKWVPYELNFGIPLFSIPLNAAVCELIEKCQLFSEKNLAVYSKQSRQLALRVLDFIAQCNGEPSVDLELGVIPFPRKIVQWPPAPSTKS